MINKVKRSEDSFAAVKFKYIPGGLWKFCVPIDSVKLFDKNPRRNDISVDELAALIKTNLFRKPIVIDQNNVIRAGNTAYKAACKLGMKMIPVAQSEFNGEGAAVDYVISDNKIGEKAQWDVDILKELILTHNLADAERRPNTGFSEVEINRLFDIKEQAEKTLRHVIEVAVTVETEDEARILYERLVKEGYKCRVLTL